MVKSLSVNACREIKLFSTLRSPEKAFQEEQVQRNKFNEFLPSLLPFFVYEGAKKRFVRQESFFMKFSHFSEVCNPGLKR